MKHFAGLAFVKQWIVSLCLVLVLTLSLAQDIGIGQWRTHFSYTKANLIAITPNKIFCASQNGLFSRDVVEGSLRKLSKIDGLSDVGVSALAYDQVNDVLVIGYRSGFVDFIYEDRILSLADIATSNLDVDKTINDISFSDAFTYLATDLGVIVVRTENATVTENYIQIGTGGAEVVVSESVFNKDTLFIRTSQGLQSGVISSNLLDFNAWTRYPSTFSYTDLTLIDNQLYALNGINLFQFSGGSWNDTGIDLPTGSTRIFESNDELTTSSGGEIYMLSGTSFEVVVESSATQINDLEIISGGYVLADEFQGLIDEAGNSLSPDGPLSDSFSKLRVISNELFAFNAPFALTYTGSQQETNYSRFNDATWSIESINGFTNVSDVAILDGNRFFSSIGDGLYDETNNQIIDDIPGSPPALDTMINALAARRNLWVSSFSFQDPIHLRDREGNWSTPDDSFFANNRFLSIDISEIGIGLLLSLGSIVAFEPEENRIEELDTSEGLPDAPTQIEISVEDNLWVATDRGPAVFSSASFVFGSEAIRPTFENRILFEDEGINAVMTDGGNRVWFATNDGLRIYDENTSELVALFNETNSPLPSDNVLQLVYNGRNGEVFIYTDRGMVSYRSPSSIGARRHSDVKIFPNPVRPEFQGQVGLSGLARNVNVKITDVNGNLVKEVDANGGTASWDLSDLRGGSVSTGIYLFFSSSADGEETYVGKIAVVR